MPSPTRDGARTPPPTPVQNRAEAASNPGGRPSETRPRIGQTIHGVRTYQAKLTERQHKPRKLRGRLKRNRAQTKPNQAHSEDVSSEAVPKPSRIWQTVRTSEAKPCPNQAKPRPSQANCKDVSGETGPKPGQTKQITRTSQAKPGPNQPKPGPNLANCEDVSSATVPKPTQTRAKPGKL